MGRARNRSKELGIEDKPTSVFGLPIIWDGAELFTHLSAEGDNELLAQLLIAIPQNNCRTVKEVTQNIIGSSSDLNFAFPGIVLKSSWVSLAAESIESDLLRECSGVFGTPKHYYSFLACHGNESPATNHLFLPNDTEIEPCYRGLFSLRPNRLTDVVSGCISLPLLVIMGQAAVLWKLLSIQRIRRLSNSASYI